MAITISGDSPNFTTASITTLNAASGVLATQNGMTGIAKAWVSFNGSGTVAILSSFNVSSITDNGTGDYTINFTTAMANANYAMVGSARAANAGIGNPIQVTANFSVAPTTSAFRLWTSSGWAFSVASGVAQDPTAVYIAFFGE
jgi:hypothetical protein